MYIFDSIIGRFVVDRKGLLLRQDANADGEDLPGKLLPVVLDQLNDSKYFKSFYDCNLTQTKKDIREAVTPDTIIIQLVGIIEDTERCINVLYQRLKDYGFLVAPEYFQENKNNREKLIGGFDEKKLFDKKDMMSKCGEKDAKNLGLFVMRINELMMFSDGQKVYMKSLMEQNCPNVNEVAGMMLGAKLIQIAGGLLRLSKMPASKIQLLGAEKALFKHLTRGAKSPKHGIIHEHPIVQGSESKGKSARALANKLSICAKLDFFKGEFKGVKIREELEKRFLK